MRRLRQQHVPQTSKLPKMLPGAVGLGATLVLSVILPFAAQAQSETVGIARGSGLTTPDVPTADGTIVGITKEQRPAFRAYVLQESVPPFTVPDRVAVGATLPEAGVTYYDVPQTFGATTYRYTVVNGETILVEPRSRRIVQVID